MTFEEFMMAISEDDEMKKALWQMATQQSEEAKREEERKELKKIAREECKKGWR